MWKAGTVGDGGGTRKPDLGIINPFAPYFESLRRISKVFDFEEDTLPLRSAVLIDFDRF